jgi:hypothetical protein
MSIFSIGSKRRHQWPVWVTLSLLLCAALANLCERVWRAHWLESKAGQIEAAVRMDPALCSSVTVQVAFPKRIILIEGSVKTRAEFDRLRQIAISSGAPVSLRVRPPEEAGVP